MSTENNKTDDHEELDPELEPDTDLEPDLCALAAGQPCDDGFVPHVHRAVPTHPDLDRWMADPGNQARYAAHPMTLCPCLPTPGLVRATLIGLAALRPLKERPAQRKAALLGGLLQAFPYAPMAFLGKAVKKFRIKPSAGTVLRKIKPQCEASLNRTPEERAYLFSEYQPLVGRAVSDNIGDGSWDMREALFAAGMTALAERERTFDPMKGTFGAWAKGAVKEAVTAEKRLLKGVVNGLGGDISLDAAREGADEDGDEMPALGDMLADDGIGRLPSPGAGAVPGQFTDDGTGERLGGLRAKLDVALAGMTSKQREAFKLREGHRKRPFFDAIGDKMNTSAVTACDHVGKAWKAIRAADWKGIGNQIAADKIALWADRLGLPVTDWRVIDNSVATTRDVREADRLAGQREWYARVKSSMSAAAYDARAGRAVLRGRTGFFVPEHRKPVAGAWVPLTADDPQPVTLFNALDCAVDALLACPAVHAQAWERRASSVPANAEEVDDARKALVGGLRDRIEELALRCRPSELTKLDTDNHLAKAIRAAGLVQEVLAARERLKAEVKRARAPAVKRRATRIRAGLPVLACDGWDAEKAKPPVIPPCALHGWKARTTGNVVPFPTRPAIRLAA